MVEGQQRVVEAGVVADRAEVLAVAGAADEHPVRRRRVVVVEPVRREVAPLGRGVAVGFVHRLEVDQGVGAVLVGHGRPHGVERGHVRDPPAGGGSVLPVGEDDLEAPVGRGVDGAAVGVPPGGADGVGVDRQSDGVGPEEGLHVVVDGVGLGPHRRIVVRSAQAVDDERSGAEVVAEDGPVHSAEVAGVGAGRCGADEDRRRRQCQDGQHVEQEAEEGPPPGRLRSVVGGHGRSSNRVWSARCADRISMSAPSGRRGRRRGRVGVRLASLADRAFGPAVARR